VRQSGGGSASPESAFPMQRNLQTALDLPRSLTGGSWGGRGHRRTFVRSGQHSLNV
jgi:hypothetical protein